MAVNQCPQNGKQLGLTLYLINDNRLVAQSLQKERRVEQLAKILWQFQVEVNACTLKPVADLLCQGYFTYLTRPDNHNSRKAACKTKYFVFRRSRDVTFH